MSIALLTAAVPAGQQLPGGMFDFNETATPANAAWFGSADNSVIPAYGNGNFVIGGTCRYGIVQGNRYLITHYLNAQNFFAIRHNGTSNTLELILFTSNAVDVVASVALHTLSCSVRWMAWRDGNTWGIAVLKGQFESTYPEILIATAGPQSGKNWQHSWDNRGERV
jgi:hypothetical protein